VKAKSGEPGASILPVTDLGPVKVATKGRRKVPQAQAVPAMVETVKRAKTSALAGVPVAEREAVRAAAPGVNVNLFAEHVGLAIATKPAKDSRKSRALAQQSKSLTRKKR
jgi:hypothetical protein